MTFAAAPLMRPSQWITGSGTRDVSVWAMLDDDDFNGRPEQRGESFVIGQGESLPEALAAANKVNEASPLIADWFNEVVADDLRVAKCDLCANTAAAAPALDLSFVRGESDVSGASWHISYLFHCTNVQCIRDTHRTLLQLRHERDEVAKRNGPQPQVACLKCLSTKDVLMNTRNGAYYCAEHRPKDAKRAVPRPLSCATCGVQRSTSPLGECTACRTVAYCGRACQRRHWPRHQFACRMISRARDVTLNVERRK